jgi:hypothetical protein
MKNSNEISKKVSSILKSNKQADEISNLSENEKESQHKVKEKLQFKIKPNNTLKKKETSCDLNKNNTSLENINHKSSKGLELTSSLINSFTEKYNLKNSTNYDLNLNEEAKIDLKKTLGLDESDDYLKNIIVENNEVSYNFNFYFRINKILSMKHLRR